MTPTEEQKKAANDLMRLLATENFAKGGSDIKPEAQELFMNELAIRFFSREQAVAENVARAIVKAAESSHKQTISVQGQYAELKDVVIGSRGVVDAVRTAAAPFIKGT